MNGITPMARRVAWVKTCFEVVPLPPPVADEDDVARAGVAPAEASADGPAAGAVAKVTVARPELSPELSLDSIVEAGEWSGVGWIRRSLSVPIPLADRLDQLSAADQRHVVELLLALFPDIGHADRLRAVLAAQGELGAIARDLRGLRGIFGKDLPPRLALHIRNAAHTWANRLLKAIGEEVPVMALHPESALAAYAPPEGVPSSWEPVVMWVPARMMHRVPDMQASITGTLAASDAKWEELVGVYFMNKRRKGQ